MGIESLSLQIAAGILIAAAILALARLSVRFASSGDYGLAFWIALPVVLLGGGLILAGMGTIPWQ